MVGLQRYEVFVGNRRVIIKTGGWFLYEDRPYVPCFARCGQVQKQLDRMDENGDGSVSRAEFDKAAVVSGS